MDWWFRLGSASCRDGLIYEHLYSRLVKRVNRDLKGERMRQNQSMGRVSTLGYCDREEHVSKGIKYIMNGRETELQNGCAL